MSLRLRLTMLYASLLGGIILIIGIVVYSVVSVVLVNQTDDLITRTVYDITSVLRVSSSGDLDAVNIPSLNLIENTYIQIWGRDGHLLSSSDNILRYTKPIDPQNLQITRPVFHDSLVSNNHLRVISVPLEVNKRQVGLLQVGISLSFLDRTQQVLLVVLIFTDIIAMGMAALVGWLVLGRALAPLETVTQVAIQITRADDLSRRIPLSGSPNDEVGQLIQAFNQTLGRLELLFTAQRRFMADVSHELRTPLTVIKANVALMSRLGEADKESLAGIENEVDRLTRMVGDLLLLAQAESGKIPLDMRPVALDTVLLEVFQQMRLLAGDRLLVKLVDIDQVVVNGDRDRLKQVFLNIGSNAIKYTPAGGQIQVGLSKSGSQVRVVVTDSGPGIPAQDIPHIFERFYRGEKSRTRSRDGGGFGLGLSIAYWIVHNHGGRIEVDSKVGNGTTFCVWLPVEAVKST
jgi:two-component system, OmpR family, sensor kinase